MGIGADIGVLHRPSHGRAEEQADAQRHGRPTAERLGRARVINSYAVQVDDRLSAAMWKKPYRAEELLLVDFADDRTYPVAHIRPGLVSPQEAAQIMVAEHCDVQLLPTTGDLVFLETELPMTGGMIAMDVPWWCRILCFKNCTGC